MPEEIGGLDVGGWGEESEITQEDVDRIRENQGQAKKIGAQIKHMQKQNSQYAKLLSLLLQRIDDDEILGYIFHQLVELKMDPVLIFAQFLPILDEHVDLSGLSSVYEPVRHAKTSYVRSLEGTVDRFKALIHAYPQLTAGKKDELIRFVVRRLHVEGVINVDELDGERKQELIALIEESV